tara:strand:- start:2155 stop:2424 length:270 start_codon:yes stop_codon:yes gene_type:complete
MSVLVTPRAESAIRRRGGNGEFSPVKLAMDRKPAKIGDRSVGRTADRPIAEEEAAMHYLEFVTALNPFVLAILALAIVCGCYDRWLLPK